MSLPETYERLLELSAQMEQVAKDQDWDALNSLQNERAKLMIGLPNQLPAISPSDTERVRLSIQQIQAHDATVMKYVMPWREQVGRLISKLTPNI